jgi:hypothetical protein
MVAPGALPGNGSVSDWMDENGQPIRFDIKFDENGIAKVDAKMGEFLIEHGYANRTRLQRIKSMLAVA